LLIRPMEMAGDLKDKSKQKLVFINVKKKSKLS